MVETDEILDPLETTTITKRKWSSQEQAMARLQEIQPSLDINLKELNAEQIFQIVELIEKFNSV